MWQNFLQLSDGYLLGMLFWLILLALTPKGLLILRRRRKQHQTAVGKSKAGPLIAFGLSLWLCLTLLTLIELGFALFYDATDSFDMTNVSRRWFRIHAEPDVRVLSFADQTTIQYRDDRDYPLLPPKAVTHSVFLGDSFTFGHGVPDVGHRFSNRLRASVDPEKQAVSNLSWPGTDLAWVEAVLKRVFADGGRVDRAVYVLCLNDIEAFHDPRMTRSIEQSRFEPPSFLFRDTYFLNWMYFRLEMLSRPGSQNYYSFVKDYYAGEPFDRFRAALHQTNRLCGDNDCRLHVVIFPFLHCLGPDYPFAEAHGRIVKQCEESEIPCLDLRDILDRHRSEGLTVNPFDAHPNERAHQLAAEAIKAAWYEE